MGDLSFAAYVCECLIMTIKVISKIVIVIIIQWNLNITNSKGNQKIVLYNRISLYGENTFVLVFSQYTPRKSFIGLV